MILQELCVFFVKLPDMKKLLFIIGFLFFSFLKIWAQNPTMVLIEVFTGASCRYCPESNAHVDSLVAANPHKEIGRAHV